MRNAPSALSRDNDILAEDGLPGETSDLDNLDRPSFCQDLRRRAIGLSIAFDATFVRLVMRPDALQVSDELGTGPGSSPSDVWPGSWPA